MRCTSLHHDPKSTGPLLFAILGAGAASTIAGGAIADRLGNKRTMLASLACVPVLLALYVLSPGATGVVAIALAGACIISTTSITVVMAQDYMPSRLALAASLVIGFTSGLGGLAVAGLGRLADISGLYTVLWALVGIAIVGTLVTALLPSDGEGRVARREETRALPDIAKRA